MKDSVGQNVRIELMTHVVPVVGDLVVMNGSQREIAIPNVRGECDKYARQKHVEFPDVPKYTGPYQQRYNHCIPGDPRVYNGKCSATDHGVALHVFEVLGLYSSSE